MVTLPARLTYLLLTLLLWMLPAGNTLHAQDSDPQVFRQGTRYLDLNLSALDRFSARATRTRARLLRQLSRREKAYASQLRHRDSAAYARYQAAAAGRPSFDSIRHLLLHPDSTTLAARFSRGAQSVADSLKGVAAFLQSSGGSIAGSAPELAKYNADINGLQSQLNYGQYIDGLTAGRVAELKSSASLNGLAGSLPALGGMQKDLYYAKSKIAAWKAVADDPSKAEEKALEYLQGREGFDAKLDGALHGGNPLPAAGSDGASPGSSGATAGALSADDLERMGYQTKRQVGAALQKQFGSSLGAVQGQMGKQVAAWQDKAKDLTGAVSDARQGMDAVRGVQKPAFKINPMRGLPFRKRIEKGYSFDTRRAQSNAPAMLDLAATAGFRYSPLLSLGAGIAASVGLGQGFSDIRLSFQGAGFRTYLAWKLVWGIGAYGGYERMYKQAFFGGGQGETGTIAPSTHNTAAYSESVLLGLTKSYHINSRYSGGIQVLYDCWWKEKNLNSPILIRFLTRTK